MMLSLHTEMCDMLGIEYPIFAMNHCRDVTAAVSKAGGIGVLGVSRKSVDEIRAQVRWIREQTDRPFGLDVLLPRSAPPSGTREELLSKVPAENVQFMIKLRRELGLPDDYRMEWPGGGDDVAAGGTHASQMAKVEAICELKPAAFAGGLGINPEAVEMCHQAGMKVISLVGNVKQARRVAGWGVDIIVAAGTESGGHTGRIGTMALVPAVVDAVKPIPVLAAGGIGDGRGLVAALALGAAGVWTGTVWLTAHEHPLEDFIKDKIVAGTEEDTVVSKVYSGKPARRLKNKFTDYWDQPGAPKPLPAPYQSLYLPFPPHISTEDADRTWERLGLHDWMGTPAGQVIGLIKERKAARQILYDMVSQAIDILGD